MIKSYYAFCANAMFEYDSYSDKLLCFVPNSIFKGAEVPQMIIRIHYQYQLMNSWH